MYRYIVDNAITYTPDDLVLFRESPFAAWMERLTLENPDHGIPPDLDSIGVNPPPPQQDDIIATLRSEGRNVALVDSQDDEPDRRVATLEAMRVGADFIVNGQLAAGVLSGAVDLLMRTSGFSELGDFLYIPCETRVENSLQSPFRLCFAAELLANLQGQLPAQMLIIRDGAEVVPLQTEDHIYYYRAVEKRFLNAMNIFRKHRMPDPAESAHFGRWAECASEVLKQQALSASNSASNQEEQQEEQQAEEAAEPVVEMPQLRVASGAVAGAQYDVDVVGRKEFAPSNYSGNYSTPEGAGCDSDTTLAEQARLLTPGRYGRGAPPGHTPSLARIGKPLYAHAAQEKRDESTSDTVAVATDSDEPVSEEPVSAKPVARKTDAKKRVLDPAASEASTLEASTADESTSDESTSDEALDNLEFIGSGPHSMNGLKFPEMDLGEAARAAPAPSLRDTSTQDLEASFAEIRSAAVQELPEREPRPPVFLPPEQHEAAAVTRTEAKDERRAGTRADSFPGETLNTQQLEAATSEPENPDSVVDLDSTVPMSTVAPVVQRAEEVFKRLIRDDPMFKKAEPANPASGGKTNNAPAASTFSSSLQTSEE